MASFRPTFSLSRKSAAQVDPLLIQLADHIGESDNPLVTIVPIFYDRGNDALLCRLPQHQPHQLFFRSGLFRQIAYPPGLIAK